MVLGFIGPDKESPQKQSIFMTVALHVVGHLLAKEVQGPPYVSWVPADGRDEGLRQRGGQSQRWQVWKYCVEGSGRLCVLKYEICYEWFLKFPELNFQVALLINPVHMAGIPQEETPTQKMYTFSSKLMTLWPSGDTFLNSFTNKN